MPLFGPSGAGGSVVKLNEVICGGAQATIAFSGIPSTYRTLYLTLVGRGDANAAFEQLWAQFNGDSGANYDYEFYQAVNNTISEGGASTQAQMIIGHVTAATAPANQAAATDWTIPQYAGTTFYKTALARCFLPSAQTSAGFYSEAYTQNWRSTAAISSITLLLQAGNFSADTVASLYGVL